MRRPRSPPSVECPSMNTPNWLDANRRKWLDAINARWPQAGPWPLILIAGGTGFVACLIVVGGLSLLLSRRPADAAVSNPTAGPNAPAASKRPAAPETSPPSTQTAAPAATNDSPAGTPAAAVSPPQGQTEPAHG